MKAFIQRLLAVRSPEELVERMLYRLGRRVWFRGFFYDRFFVFSLALDNPLLNKKPPPLPVRIAGPADMDRLASLAHRRPESYTKRLDDGTVCFVAEKNGNPAGWTWVRPCAAHYEKIDDYTISLPPHSLWAYDSFVLPEYRCAGVWRSLVAAAAAAMRREGLRRMYCVCDHFDAVSIAAHGKIGYRIRREVIFLRALFLRAHFHRKMLSPGRARPWRPTVAWSRRPLVPIEDRINWIA